MNQLVPIRGARTPSTPRHGRRGLAVPAAIAGAGDTAVRRFLEFFAATIRNKNTRMAYYRAVTDFFAWLDAAGIVVLVDIEPLHVATYIEALQERMAKPTVKQHLAAIRMLFDWLVTALPRLVCVLAQSSGTRSRVVSSSAAR
jgi:Phage integrase, N-terminal SAM-like domain